MPYFKDKANAIHFLDDVAFEHLLPDGSVKITDEEAAILQAPPPPTQAQIVAQYESALDAHLDAIAKAHRYDDRKSFVLRAGYAGPYQAEGIAFAQWMDDCNVKAYALLQSVIAGEVEMPTIEAMIAGLPVFTLP